MRNDLAAPTVVPAMSHAPRNFVPHIRSKREAELPP